MYLYRIKYDPDLVVNNKFSMNGWIDRNNNYSSNNNYNNNNNNYIHMYIARTLL